MQAAGGFRILLTNDDGISAPGLAACAEALCAAGCYDVRVAAPESERSGSGHAITLGHDLEAMFDPSMLRLESGHVVAAASVRSPPRSPPAPFVPPASTKHVAHFTGEGHSCGLRQVSDVLDLARRLVEAPARDLRDQ